MRDERRFDLHAAIAPWVMQMKSFVRGDLNADNFVAYWDRVYKADDTNWSDPVFDELDGLYADVDSYEADPELRRYVIDGIGPDELRTRVRALMLRAGYEVDGTP